MHLYTVANAEPEILTRLRPRPRASRSKQGSSLPLITCVMRYHPSIHYGLRVALRSVPLPADIAFSIVPSWANALPCTSSLVNRANVQASSSRMINDLGTSYLQMSEEGGNIVVVPGGVQTHNPVHSISKMSIAHLEELFNQ